MRLAFTLALFALAATNVACEGADGMGAPQATGVAAGDGGSDVDADAGTTAGDAGPADGGPQEDADAGSDGAAPDAGAASCAAPIPDYACTVGDASTCPGGQCWFGSCVGPAVDDERFAACGDGTCAGCEAVDGESRCPRDCGPTGAAPVRAVEGDATLTVFIHGIEVLPTASIEAQTWGAATHSGALGEQALAWDAELGSGTLVDGLVDPGAPRQIVAVEYYGTHPDPMYSAEEKAWVEEIPFDSPKSLERYARVIALFIQHGFPTSGAGSIQLLCHSMGCYVSRYLLENDVGGVASSGLITRLVTVSGALQGARMANMVDNPFVQQAAGDGAFNIWDISALDPDHARAVVAPWDHRLERANNPLFTGMRIHSVGGSDPTLDEAFDLFSLGAIHNPELLPEDGVVFTLESFFAGQDEAVRAHSADGRAVLPTHAFLDRSHNAITRDSGTGLLVWAGLVAHTQVEVTLASLTLMADHESHTGIEGLDGERGRAPAELALESFVRVVLRDGREVLVDERKLEDHTPELTFMNAGETSAPGLSIFSGPIPDDATALHITANLVEVDRDRRFGVEESLLVPASAPIASFDGLVSLGDPALLAGPLTVDLVGTDASGRVTITRDRF